MYYCQNWKIELGIDLFGKYIDTSISVVIIDKNVLFPGQICYSKWLVNPKWTFSTHKYLVLKSKRTIAHVKRIGTNH